jgi:hypothetical protein
MHINFRARLREALVLVLFLIVITTKSSLAANIVIDGQFADWTGKPNITDPAGDVTPITADLTALYWATNPGDPTVYFMVQRNYPGASGSQTGYYRVYVDTNCNGNYSEARDRIIYVTYDPTASQGLTTVKIYAGNAPSETSQLATHSGNWGDHLGSAPTGGTRTEFGVSYADLGIGSNQQLCFWVGSFPPNDFGDDTPIDRIPGSGIITWTPIPALDYPLLALVIGGVIAVVWKRKAFAVAWQTR